MGHEYVKESETFNVNRNGTVPKPTQAEIEAGKVLKADGTWGEGGGGGGGNVDDVLVNGISVVDENHNAQIVSYKEVTQAEYNALPSSKETDGVLYCIKDVGGADGFPPLIYSEEEREIGVWRDGKPLYQKVFSLNNAEIQVNTFYEIPNTDKTQYDTYVHCYLIDSYGQAWCAAAGYSGNNVAVFVHSNRTRNYNYAIIQYTKSADTAGSGTWNQQGALSHHYSTSENVIGTWIDGKPLYEKTFTNVTADGGSSTSRHYSDVMDLSSLNVDTMVDIKGWWFDGSTWKVLNCVDQYSLTLVWESAPTSQKIRMITQNVTGTKNLQFTIQYTKTTD